MAQSIEFPLRTNLIRANEGNSYKHKFDNTPRKVPNRKVPYRRVPHHQVSPRWLSHRLLPLRNKPTRTV